MDKNGLKVPAKEKATERYICQLLEKYLRKINPSDIYDFSEKDPCIGLLVELYRRKAGDSASPTVFDALEQYKYYPNILTKDEMECLEYNLLKTFQCHMHEYARPSLDCYSTFLPMEVCRFIYEWSEVFDPFFGVKEVYIPFAGLMDLASNSFGMNVRCEEIYAPSLALGEIYMFAQGETEMKRLKSTLTENLSIDSAKKHKAIFASVCGCFSSDDTFIVLNKLYDKLSAGGIMVCVVDQGLVSGRNEDEKNEEGFVYRLIKDHTLNSVVRLPENLFPKYGSDEPYLLFISKSKYRECYLPLMVDATSYTIEDKQNGCLPHFNWKQLIDDIMDCQRKTGRFADGTVDRICTRVMDYDIVQYDLRPQMYLFNLKDKSGNPYIPLSNLATQIEEFDSKTYVPPFYLDCKWLPYRYHYRAVGDEYFRKYNPNLNESRFLAISSECVLIMPGEGDNVIRTAYMDEVNSVFAVKPDYVKVLKPNDGVSAKYLAALLEQPDVQSQFEKFRQRRRLFKPNVILNLDTILVPDHKTEEERRLVVSGIVDPELRDFDEHVFDRNNKRNAEEKSKLEDAEYMQDDVNMMLQSLEGKCDALVNFGCRSGWNLVGTDMVDDEKSLSVRKLLVQIQSSVSSLSNQLASLSVKTDWGDAHEMDVYTFIEQYLRSHSGNPLYEMKNIGEPDFRIVADGTLEPNGKEPLIKVPELLLTYMFDEIVDNAAYHGFADRPKDKNIVEFNWMADEDSVTVTVSNNGAPLDSVASPQLVMTKGFTTSRNYTLDEPFHFGLGVYRIKKLMEKYGSLEIVSTPEKEFTLTYRLTFHRLKY